MTRRYVVFVDTDGRRHVAGEYNGCKSEYATRETLFGVSLDGCDKDWKDIQEEFDACKTLDDFKATAARVDGYYHSAIGGPVTHEIRVFDPGDAEDGEFLTSIHLKADEIVYVGNVTPDTSVFWWENSRSSPFCTPYSFDSETRGLTVYSLEEFWVDDEDVSHDASTIGLFADIAAARKAFTDQLGAIFAYGKVSEWAQESTFEQKFYDDCYECRKDPENSVSGYRIQIKPIQLALSEDVFMAIGRAYRDWVYHEDLESKVLDMEELATVPMQRIQEFLDDPILPSLIDTALSNNESYMESYWLTLEKIANEKLEKYVALQTTISVAPTKAKRINYLLTHEPKDESECFGEDESISLSATFTDGCRVCIDICGVKYEEGKSNLPWTQAVLYDARGRELACTEAENYFFGKWEFDSSLKYQVMVVEESSSVNGGGSDHGV